MDVEAVTLDVLFSDACAAFVHAVAEPAALAGESRRSVDLDSVELDLLLVDWLSELLFRFDTEGFLPATCDAVVTRGTAATPASEAGDRQARWRLHADLVGMEAAANRVPIKVLIKAVTYHQLEVRQTDAGWSARIIFDI